MNAIDSRGLILRDTPLFLLEHIVENKSGDFQTFVRTKNMYFKVLLAIFEILVHVKLHFLQYFRNFEPIALFESGSPTFDEEN